MAHPDTSPAAPPFSMALAALGVLLASILFGLVPYFSRGLTEGGLAPHAIAFYRYILAAVFLLPFLWWERARWPELLMGAFSGLLMGLGWMGYVIALNGAPVSTVGVLYMTYPVFTLLVAWLLFKDRPGKRGIVSALLIVLAAAVASSPAAVSPEQLPLLVLSLAAPFGFGFAICVLVYKLTVISPLARIASASVGGILGLLPLMLTSAPQEVLPGDAAQWVLVAGIGLGTALVPQLIYVVSTPVVGAARASVLGSVELPTMFVVGLVAFGEPIGPSQMLGCVLVVGAIALMSRSTRGPARAAAE
ncbi:MAG: DMT family transporter [Roseovarius sp.]